MMLHEMGKGHDAEVGELQQAKAQLVSQMTQLTQLVEGREEALRIREEELQREHDEALGEALGAVEQRESCSRAAPPLALSDYPEWSQATRGRTPRTSSTCARCAPTESGGEICFAARCCF